MKRKFLWIALTAGVVGLWTALASADIIFTPGNNPQPDEANILFTSPETGTTIIGEVDHTNIDAIFSSTQSLTQKAQGQADIFATGPKGTELTNIVFNLESGFLFNDFIMNLANGHGDATVTVQTENATHTYTLGNGQNYLTITTINDELMTSVAVQMDPTGGFLDFKQPRISGVCETTTQGCTPVPEIPEPQSLALLGLGLFGLGLTLRRKI